MLSLVPPPTDLEPLGALLAASGLPAGDLAEPGRRFWRAVTAAGASIGYGGLEGAGSDLLPRSVVIDGRHRGMGAGRRLVECLLAQAKAEGASKVWLLTLDAADFFRRFGFVEVERSAAPASVAASQQFGGLCPARARLMVRGV